MIDYLEQLVEAGEFAKAIELGEQLLKSRENNQRQLLIIHCCLLRSHCSVGHEDKAIMSGELCLRLGEEEEEWDYRGSSCLYLGVAYSRLGQHHKAAELFLEYFRTLPKYAEAARHQLMAWYNLGLTYVTLGETDKAESALSQALRSAVHSGNDRTLHGIRQALASVRVSLGHFDTIPRLLAQSAAYLRKNPDEFMTQQSSLEYIELRARFAHLSGRSQRSKLLAVRGMEASPLDSEYPVLFHLLLSRVALKEGCGVEAFGHASAAQTLAKSRRRPDLEAEAGELVGTALQLSRSVAVELDKFYAETEH